MRAGGVRPEGAAGALGTRGRGRLARVPPDLRRRPHLLAGWPRRRRRARRFRRAGSNAAIRGGRGLAAQCGQKPAVGQHGWPPPVARLRRRRGARVDHL
eukprot:5201599-Lingulodinium_polyedra.AAC.1